jgi:hypothetical protein
VLVHTKLNTTVEKAMDTISSYRTSATSSANADKDTRAATKAPTTLATAMDSYAHVISQAIDFGSSYTYQTGLLAGFTTGLDRYAPDLNTVTATGTQTTLLSSTTVYYDRYARVYFVVTDSKKNRLISKDNYVIREGDYTMADLVASATEAFYFTDDDVDVAVSSANKHVITATEDKIVGASLTYSTPTSGDLAGALTALVSSDTIYYSPNKRLYMVLKSGVYKRLFTSAGAALAGYYADASNTRDGLLLHAYIMQFGNYYNSDAIDVSSFNDLLVIYPGVKTRIVTVSDTIRKDADGKYYVQVTKADTSNTTVVSSQLWLIPLRTRYGLQYVDGVYGESSTKAQLLSRDAYFYTENYQALASTIVTTVVS